MHFFWDFFQKLPNILFSKSKIEIRINNFCGHPLYVSNDIRMIALA